MTRRILSLLTAALAGIVSTAACGGGGEKAAPEAAPQAAAPSGPLSPAPGGEIIKVELSTDAQGNNRFTPSEVTAHPGDVLRFTLVAGVHNVHFLPDSNPGVPNLPPASELLQLPGQTHDIAVSFKPGRYYFQCDPHALLGMIGHLTVQER